MKQAYINSVLEKSSNLNETSIDDVYVACDAYIGIEKKKMSALLSDESITNITLSTYVMATAIDLDIIFNGEFDDMQARVELKKGINARHDIDTAYVGELSLLIAKIHAVRLGVQPIPITPLKDQMTEEEVRKVINEALVFLDIGYLTYAVGLNERTQKPVVYVAQINTPSTPKAHIFHRQAVATITAIMTAIESSGQKSKIEVKMVQLDRDLAKLFESAIFETDRGAMIEYVSAMSEIDDAEMKKSINLTAVRPYKAWELGLISDWVTSYRSGNDNPVIFSSLNALNADFFGVVNEFSERLLPVLKDLKSSLPKEVGQFKILLGYAQSYLLELLYDRSLVVNDLVELNQTIDSQAMYHDSPMSFLFEELMTGKGNAGEMFSPVFYERTSDVDIKDRDPAQSYAPSNGYRSSMMH